MLTLIAAMDERGAIGFQDQLLWSLPADMAHFKASTLGKPIVMGSVTARGLGRALPKRPNLVLTRQGTVPYPGQLLMSSVEEVLAFAQAHPEEEIMVIGGAQVYQAFLPHATQLLLTHVADRVDQADAFFPLAAIRNSDWQVTEILLDQPADDRHGRAFQVRRYERAPSLAEPL